MVYVKMQLCLPDWPVVNKCKLVNCGFHTQTEDSNTHCQTASKSSFIALVTSLSALCQIAIVPVAACA